VPSSQSRPREERTQPARGSCVLFYDGACGLCQRTVLWMMCHDPCGRLLYATQQQPLAAEVFARHTLDAQQTNSVVLVLHFGQPAERVVVRSDAIIGCLSVFGGRWALLAAVARLIPRALRDGAYNWIARNRHGLLANSTSCTLPTAAERTRFFDI